MCIHLGVGYTKYAYSQNQLGTTYMMQLGLNNTNVKIVLIKYIYDSSISDYFNTNHTSYNKINTILKAQLSSHKYNKTDAGTPKNPRPP